MTAAGPRVVALGGGHGLATTLGAVRHYAARVTAVVSVADDGGSSGRLRQIAGIPAPGDLRRCLVAMAADRSLWARAFEYRFPCGDLEGHALGNLIIAGLANVTGDFGQALQVASELVEATGQVLPATSVPVVLKAEVAGTEVVGQVNVASSEGPIGSVSIVPPDAPVSDEVITSLVEADQIVIGPGSLFTSVLAVCSVPAIRDVLASATRARQVYVCNLRPQVPETAGYSTEDHVRAVLDHGITPDAVVISAGCAVPSGGGSIAGIPLVMADLAREDGSGHDPDRLAAVLQLLT